MVWELKIWFGNAVFIFLKTPYIFCELRLLFVKSIYDKETLCLVWERCILFGIYMVLKLHVWLRNDWDTLFTE